MNIIEITAEETAPIRHEVLWPNEPIDFVILPNDAIGRHFGLFLNETLISVVSLFVKHKEVQFRKFATCTEYQGKGYGTLLLNEIMRIVQQEKLSRMWCNARVNKINYYTKFGMRVTHTYFSKKGIDYVVMERKF
ncbi:GNAT family N-acetyltransferase [Maribacter sp. ACAM166]|nr:GNAT family N-acetyltransferase [Maribacter sp. ACAM166]